MHAIERSAVIRLNDVLEELKAAGEQSGKVANRVTLDLKLNRLTPPNASATHKQDEIYIVLEGQGTFVHDGRPERFGPGDFLFVGAGVAHHFEDFEALTLWRIYYGPEGGELSTAQTTAAQA